MPAGTGELKATVAWDDFAAAAYAGFAPVNDLNLELVSPGAVTFRPWVLASANPHLNATTGVNTLDNQEQVRVINPQAGVWTVRVVGTTVPQGPQAYGLTFTSLPNRYDAALCTGSTWGFEAGNDGWTLNGATRVAAPAPGHGSWSLQFGPGLGVVHEATRNVTIPTGSGRAELTYWWYLQTQHPGAIGSNYDALRLEVRTTAGTVLAVLGEQQDSWRANTWMTFTHVDLTPWAGQTVTLAFRYQEKTYPPGGGFPADNLSTTIWVDDINLTTCPLARTDVWSRDLATDTGVEPNPDPGPMWTSPDIWVRNQDDGGTAHQNPEFGQTNYIHVNVRNRSLVEGVNVPVKFYIANASAGLSWPTQWTQIGSAVILPSVMPGQVVVAKTAWNPPGLGHFCLVVRLDTSQDPMTFAEGTNITANVRNNNNIVWKNVNIVNLIPPGTAEGKATGAQNDGVVEFLFRNPEEFDMEINLVFRNERGSQNFLSRGRVTVSLDPEMAEIWAANGYAGDGIERIDDLTITLTKAPAFITVPLAALQEFKVKMAFQDTGVIITPADNAVIVPAPDPIPHQIVYRFSAVEENAADPTQEALGGVTYEIPLALVAIPVDPQPHP